MDVRYSLMPMAATAEALLHVVAIMRECIASIGIHVPCHSSPHCALCGARFRCCIVGLGAAARLHHAVVRLDFVVLEPVELLLSRSVAMRPLLVTLVAIVSLQ